MSSAGTDCRIESSGPRDEITRLYVCSTVLLEGPVCASSASTSGSGTRLETWPAVGGGAASASLRSASTSTRCSTPIVTGTVAGHQRLLDREIIEIAVEGRRFAAELARRM